MKTRCLILAAALLLVAIPAAAQAPDERPALRYEFRTYAIQHAEAEDVAGLLSRLLQGLDFRAVADARVNQLIVATSSGGHEQVGDMVQRLDVPVTRVSTPTYETRILTPRHRPADAFLKSLEMQLSQVGKLALDGRRNAIVVRDSTDRVEELERLLNDLDVAPQSLSLQFLVLGPGGNPIGKVLDASRVVEELRSLGLDGYGIVGRAAVRTVEHSSFEAAGQFAKGMISINGRVRLQTPNRVAEVSLEASIAIESGRSQEGERTQGFRRSEAQIETTLNVPVGHLMVVGLAPAGGEASEPLVLVVRAAAE